MLMVSVLLAAAIQHSNPRLSPRDRAHYASWVREEARAHNLDPWIFHALINRETRWTATAVRHEGDGSCSVGLGQINVPCTAVAMQPLLDPRTNIHRMGSFLAKIRGACTRGCASLGWLKQYNPGNAEYLSAVQADVRKHHAEGGEQVVRGARAVVHLPRLRVQAAD
jgi:hypothetical protein